jgi:hypothetical protein
MSDFSYIILHVRTHSSLTHAGLGDPQIGFFGEHPFERSSVVSGFDRLLPSSCSELEDKIEKLRGR